MLNVRCLLLIYILASWILLAPVGDLASKAKEQDNCLSDAGMNATLIRNCFGDQFIWGTIMSIMAISLFVHNLMISLFFLASSDNCNKPKHEPH